MRLVVVLFSAPNRKGHIPAQSLVVMAAAKHELALVQAAHTSCSGQLRITLRNHHGGHRRATVGGADPNHRVPVPGVAIRTSPPILELAAAQCCTETRMTRRICRTQLLTRRFQHLADLLSRAENLTIRACIRERPPCAVSRLATIVCEALPLWAYGLDILTCLCGYLRTGIYLHAADPVARSIARV